MGSVLGGLKFDPSETIGEAATTVKYLRFGGTFSPLPYFQGTLWCMPHNMTKKCADEVYPRLNLLGNSYLLIPISQQFFILPQLSHTCSKSPFRFAAQGNLYISRTLCFEMF